jgi:glycosyltransferase involved in cell wall biosynthesis
MGKGGAERSCAILSRMLEAQGHEVHIAILTDEVDYPYAGQILNLGKLKSQGDTFLKRLARFKKLRDYLKKNRFDLVIDNRPKNNFPREVFYDRCIYSKIPRVYVVHSANKENYFTDRPEKMAKIYNKNITNVAVSEYIRREIMEKSGVKNSQVIHNAFDPAWSKSTHELPDKLTNKTYLLWYGRVDNSVKDLGFLLESFQESKLWEKGIQVVIMGDGKDLGKTKQMTSNLPCGKEVVFLPFIKNPFSIISAARAVVLTSKYEGFPMVLVESLSVGTPVVSLDIKSGPSEIIAQKNNGLLVSGRNPISFAKALCEICFDESLYQACKQNAKSSVENFSMENIGKKWEELLQTHLKAVQ